ncbi:hypothetical protein BHE74_00042248, partial [Ensete ventricosum]
MHGQHLTPVTALALLCSRYPPMAPRWVVTPVEEGHGARDDRVLFLLPSSEMTRVRTATGRWEKERTPSVAVHIVDVNL